MPYPPLGAGAPVLTFPDPIVALIGWLSRFEGFDLVVSKMPAKTASRLPFVFVRESGGAGLHDHRFRRVRLQLECWASTSEASQAAAQRLCGLITVWDQYEDVWAPQIIQDPTYMPDPDGTPVHRLAAEVSFVGEEEIILSTEGA